MYQKKLIENGHKIVGIDNLNSYYDVKLKKDRHKYLKYKFKKNFLFFKIDLKNYSKLKKLFKKEKFDYVINLLPRQVLGCQLISLIVILIQI